MVSGTAWGNFINLNDRLTLQVHAENLCQFNVRLTQPGGEKRLFSAGVVSLLKNRRTHIAGVQTTGDIRFFVDGKLVNVARFEGKQFVKSERSALIGGGSMGFFEGFIDEVRISNTARYDKDFTPETRFKADEKTLALYHCDEGSGFELKDSSGKNHHGKIVGAEWVQTDRSPINTAHVASSTPPLATAPFNVQQARAHQEAWAKHLGTTVETTNSVGAKMILIPPGEFLMGSSDEQLGAIIKEVEELNLGRDMIDRILKQERPQHRVILTRPFFLGATEVTIGQFKKFVEVTGFQTYAEKNATDDQSRTYLKPGYPVTDDSPVSCGLWEEAGGVG